MEDQQKYAKKKYYNVFNILNRIRFFKQKNNISNKTDKHISIAIIAMLIIWIGSGFYTIKEADRGVVLRFGKLYHLVYPGLNWKPTFIDTVTTVNVESVREIATSGIMLTSDENIVRVEMNVQYRVVNPKNYLFSVTNADDSLRQATDSALRGVIGKYTMDRILTEGRTLIRSDTQQVLENTIKPYNMGIIILDVNFQTARPPEAVKASFDDAIAARENEQQYIREAEAYANEVQPRAQGQAQRILEEGYAYKSRTVLEAKGEIKRFTKILPQYIKTPKIVKERLYIEIMEYILKHAHKILVNDNSHKILVLPLQEIFNNLAHKKIQYNSDIHQKNKTKLLSSSIPSKTNFSKHNEHVPRSVKSSDNIINTMINQRLINAQRNHIFRDGRNN